MGILLLLFNLKSWLSSLGWEPRTFEYRKNKAGEVKAIPQIYVDDQVCDSIKELYESLIHALAFRYIFITNSIINWLCLNP